MKKFFTFVFCALCAVSLQATVVEIGTGTETSEKLPISIGNIYYALSQQVYLKKEFTGVASGDKITSIKFHYASSSSACTRTWEIYINATDKSDMPTGDKFVACGTKVYDGEVSLPASASWFEIPITAYEWQGGNIVLTVYDKTGNKASSYAKSFYVTTANWRGMSTSAGYGSDPYDLNNITSIKGSYINYIPNVQFIFGGGDDPTPTIDNPSPSSLEYGTIYLDEGDVEKTFKVTASDLTNDITLTTNASAGVTIFPSEIVKDNTDLAGDGVVVTVTLSKGYPFPNTNPTITIASEDATSKSVTINATEGQFSTLTWLSALNKNGYYFLNFEVTIDEINASDKSMVIKATTTQNANYTLIDGQATFAIDGKFSGLKGKYEDEVFKIFSYTSYTAPDPSTSIEIDEEVDNSENWPESTTEPNKSLIIKRTVVPDCWNTICLPTYLTSTQVTDIFGTGADVRSFTGANITSSSITLNFSEDPKTDGIEAGVPYLIKPTKAMDNPLNLTNQSFNPTPGSVENNGIVFQGVLVPTEVGGGGDEYIIVGANNTLLHPTESGTINGMRAYFHVVGPAAIAALKTAKVSMNTGSTTELVLIKDNQTKPYKTMVNDQIVIVKEGQKVNIFGQTVK